MRKYSPKQDAQKKVYFADRFYIAPQLPKISVEKHKKFINDLNALQNNFTILDAYVQLDSLVIYINPTDNVEIIKFLKEKRYYEMMMELSAIDYIATKDGFEIFYEMLSIKKHRRLRVKCFIQKDEELNSVESIFKMANWSEREMYDMYGVKVINHHSLKRILMPDDWYDHPLKKSYPLQGDETAQWYEVDKIFGRENREVIGPEIRDAAAIDRYDTTRFARLGHEVPYGVDISNENEPKHTPLAYQEEGGVGLFGKRIIKELHEDKTEQLDKRR